MAAPPAPAFFNILPCLKQGECETCLAFSGLDESSRNVILKGGPSFYVECDSTTSLMNIYRLENACLSRIRFYEEGWIDGLIKFYEEYPSAVRIPFLNGRLIDKRIYTLLSDLQEIRDDVLGIVSTNTRISC